MTIDDVVVDALPYIDHGYDEPGVREAALAMVEDETRRYRPTKNYLEHLPALNLGSFETSLMKKEFDRLAARQPMDTLSMKRYELPTPPAGKMTDVQAWTECVDNSMAQLEHQRTRILNLDLMLEYGGESWKIYNDVLQDLLNKVQTQLGEVKKEIQEVNWSRKNQQTQVGDKLKQLESDWVGLVSKNYEIEQALLTMEYEYSILVKQHTM
ncbi:pre-mRNA-splicing factor SPF27 [Eurytemora carolleeae]|uniref:pre-mRNA-splicing factor SPF27 n=1 Tax=Eurytemora carolleeae TaxID=1294199 RepID=UPI000C771D37|nr:pre-mRNA-splicing factor SPF27 [Eurytemora carolleeae]|eukprot:XP_023330381.1 pre-mRNA-splicing factor SPF27-like [Eurytemora affinis]